MSFVASQRFTGPREGYVFTTRERGTGYYPDARGATSSRVRKASDADDASSSSLSSSSEAKKRRRKEKKRRKKEAKKAKKEKKRKKSDKEKKKKKKRKRSESADSSSSSGSDDSNVVRSAISGKRIRMKVDKTPDDLARDEGRKAMLRYMNQVSER